MPYIKSDVYRGVKFGLTNRGWWTFADLPRAGDRWGRYFTDEEETTLAATRQNDVDEDWDAGVAIMRDAVDRFLMEDRAV